MTKKTEQTTQEPAQEPVQAGATCTVPDCDRPVYVRGLCEEHWAEPKT